MAYTDVTRHLRYFLCLILKLKECQCALNRERPSRPKPSHKKKLISKRGRRGGGEASPITPTTERRNQPTPVWSSLGLPPLRKERRARRPGPMPEEGPPPGAPGRHQISKSSPTCGAAEAELLGHGPPCSAV